MKRALLVVLLLFVSGCRSNLWKDVSEKAHTEAELERERQLCLGVTVPLEERETALGVVVQRVLRESPADQAGLAPGDEIRSIGGRIVRNARELEGALRSFRRTSGDNVGDATAASVDIVIASCGEERVLRCKLTTWGDHLRLARERCQTHAKTYESSINVPLLFEYSCMAIPEDLFRDYFGQQLAEPLLLYRDVDVVPLLGFFSLFRFERTSYREGWRLQLLSWPLVFTRISDDDRLKEKLALGEDRFEVL